MQSGNDTLCGDAGND
ncbi:hypothetical protein [Microcoleus sp. AT3-D2]